MTDFFDPLYSNEQLKSYIRLKIADNSLPHALIFEGARGSGKTTAAIMTVQSLSPEFSEKIAKLATPDLTVTEPADGKKSIGVATIRQIKEDAFIKPQELDVRVFIIKQSELMTTEAQNALLKILEEPPKNVYFFLLCENASLLLPTVRSRAPVVKMSVIADKELEKYMLQTSKKAEIMYKNSPDEFRMTIRSCAGSIGLATKKLGSPSADAQRLRESASALISLLAEGKRDKTLLFFVKSKLNKEALNELLHMLSCAVRDMLKLKYGELQNPLFFLSPEDAEEMSADFPRLTLIELYTASESLRDKLTVNVNIDAFCVRCADVLSDIARK